jgi:hypothetical protein
MYLSPGEIELLTGWSEVKRTDDRAGSKFPPPIQVTCAQSWLVV